MEIQFLADTKYTTGGWTHRSPNKKAYSNKGKLFFILKLQYLLSDATTKSPGFILTKKCSMLKKFIQIVFISFLTIQAANAQSNDEKKWLRKKYNSLSFNQKIAQLMIIRAHSNWDINKVDSLGSLIKKYNVGGLCFFQGGVSISCRPQGSPTSGLGNL